MTKGIDRPDAERVTGARAAQVRQVRGRMPEEFYPSQAKRDLLDGVVSVDLLINEEGFVVEAAVLDESPAGVGFALAALDVTKTWEFDNALHKLVVMTVRVAFLP